MVASGPTELYRGNQSLFDSFELTMLAPLALAHWAQSNHNLKLSITCASLAAGRLKSCTDV